ncbi:MAG: glycosyltransferase [Anaerolineaceae bacterium]|nr:glycosyltransferase [Anaerolineaceae bacterium]MDD4042893.1 glycosyltransferase [Anaerolineaceae bacterium]MDD4577115.1 glycosyltransferase [Anaerolineaceae bacterium]
MNEDCPVGISVVIPTHGRVRLTEKLLISLNRAKEKFDHPSEILIIDDSPEPDRQAIIALCHENNARFLPGQASVREKRNQGIKESSYSIVLFVDSDCEASDDLFTEHFRIYEAEDPQIAGCVGVTEFIGEDTWMWDVITRTQFLNAFSFAKRLINPPWATCSNTSYRRDILVEMEGFETNWPGKLGADDTDLGLRLGKAGYLLRSNPDAIVTHSRETWSSFASVWSRSFRWGRMDVYLYYRRHKDRVKILAPGLRHLLPFIILFSVVAALITQSWLLLLTPAFWLVITILFRGFFTILIDKKNLSEFFREVTADVLGLAFEFGTLFESFVAWEPTCFYKTVQRGPVLPTFTSQEKIVEEWAMWIAWLLFGIIYVAFFHRGTS